MTTPFPTPRAGAATIEATITGAITGAACALLLAAAPLAAQPRPPAVIEARPATDAQTETAPEVPAPDLTLSREIGQNGIAATAARLAAVVEPPPEDRFALAALRFLGTIEGVMQQRYAVGLSDEVARLPLLSLPLPRNPDPQPFEATLIRDIMAAIPPQMAEARAPLAGLEDEFGLDIDFADLWFDINANGTRDMGEDLATIAGFMFGFGPRAPFGDSDRALPVVRLDLADAAWLSAYSHMLTGFAQVVLAYDPTDAIAEMMETRAAFAALSPVDDPLGGFVDQATLDTIAVIVNVLRSQPDAAMGAAARDSYLAMIADNRLFWQRAAAETDNIREWIPNARQTSATGIELPPETGEAWLDVLTEIEDVLEGRALIPYWRSGAGLNVSRMFTEPRPVDLVGWIQGAAALPYLEEGPLASGTALNVFNNIFWGDTLFMAVWLN